jgi:hypothetical protein
MALLNPKQRYIGRIVLAAAFLTYDFCFQHPPPMWTVIIWIVFLIYSAIKLVVILRNESRDL